MLHPTGGWSSSATSTDPVLTRCDSSALLASKSPDPQGDEAAQDHAEGDAHDEDEAVAAAGHGGRAVHRGQGQLGQAGDLLERDAVVSIKI